MNYLLRRSVYSFYKVVHSTNLQTYLTQCTYTLICPKLVQSQVHQDFLNNAA
jgi:hypothetical protein